MTHIEQRTRDSINHDITAIRTIDLPELGRRLHQAISTAIDNPSKADGMPTQTIGAAPNTNPTRINIDDEQVTWMPTEAAGNQRTNHRKDEHQRHTERARTHLANAARELLAAQHTLNQLDKIRDNRDGVSTEEGCCIMDQIGGWEPVYRRTLWRGDSLPLGEWAYKFLLRLDRLPTELEAQQHARGQRIMVKA